MGAGDGKIVSKSKKSAKAKPTQAMAMHEIDGDNHIVGVGNLRVIVCQDEDKTWLAQGLEIDYLATGDSAEEAKTNFEIGFKATINLHIKIHRTIEHLLKVAPQNIWKSLKGEGTQYRYSQVSFHEDLFKALPYPGINFIEEPEGAAA